MTSMPPTSAIQIQLRTRKSNIMNLPF